MVDVVGLMMGYIMVLEEISEVYWLLEINGSGERGTKVCGKYGVMSPIWEEKLETWGD